MAIHTVEEAARAAKEAYERKREIIDFLRMLPVSDIEVASEKAGLRRFPIKLRSYPGDITPSMLVKITQQLYM